jgi:outer membrane biosynthesis protein TonB
MPSKPRQKKSARPSPRRVSPPRRPPAKKPAPAPARKPAAAPAKKPVAKGSSPATPKSSSKSAASAATPQLEVPLPGGRRHVLSLSFVRDGDEFLARLETDSGHITELKNRSLDQLLTLVASELEDLLE